MGPTAEVDDVVINYTIRDLYTGEILKTEEETLAVEQVLTFTRSIQMPYDVPVGDYVLQATARYWYGRKHAPASISFKVISEPWPLRFLRWAFMQWYTWVIVFVLFPSAIYGVKYYKKWLEDRKKKQRYLTAVEGLPTGDKEDSVMVGKLAGTYFSIGFPVKKMQ